MNETLNLNFLSIQLGIWKVHGYSFTVRSSLDECIVWDMIVLFVLLLYIQARYIAQSICTHYSKISGRPDIFLGSGDFQKVLRHGSQKVGCKYRVIVTQKEKRQPGLSFFNNNGPIFLHPDFCKKQCPWYFKSSRP